MAKYNFDDSELQKLFAEAGAAVKKAQATPPKAPEREEKASEVAEPPPGEMEQDEAHFEAAAAHPPDAMAHKPASAPAPIVAGPVKAIQIFGGTQDNINFNGIRDDNTTVTFPWKAVQCLALGRVENFQIIAWIYNGRIYYVTDKNITFKGLISQLAPSATQNWRIFLGDLTDKTGQKEEKGLQAFQTPGGLIPKYNTLEDFFRYLQTLK